MPEYALVIGIFAMALIGGVAFLQDQAEDRHDARRVIDYGESGATTTGLGPAPTTTSTTAAPTPAPAGSGSHVSALSPSAKNKGPSWEAIVTILVTDANGDPVRGVTVAGAWSTGTGPGDASSCQTGNDGRCEVKVTVNDSVGSSTWTLSDLAGADYDPARNTADTRVVNQP